MTDSIIPLDYRSLTREKLEALAVSLELSAFRGRQLFRWLWRPGFITMEQATDLSRDTRRIFAEKGRIYNLDLHKRQVSRDGTEKFGFRLSDGLTIETVLIPEEDHHTLCLSTQVGCAMGCAFCHTARMGFKRNLLPSEIAGQVLAVQGLVEPYKWPRNLVFMGMGEPLANFKHLLTSLNILSDDLGLNFSSRRITVSTCGLVPEMLELGSKTTYGLAVSLHATTDEIRDRIMPVNRRYPLKTLLAACKSYPLPKRRRITFEYLLLADVNDSPADARRLVRLLSNIPSKINLIPFNASVGISFNAPALQRVMEFQAILVNAGFTAMIRKSKGQDIAAACGQLYAKGGQDVSDTRLPVERRQGGGVHAGCSACECA
ncbi:MAG: 23S rRNA (adenine(2503)-C(2))-methyltransferase RlmN [Dissulfuribacterales bacterium]